MDCFPTPDQQLLADTAADLARRVTGAEAPGDAGFDPGTWRQMAALGWTTLPPVELALVVEQLGRTALPSPLVVTGALRNALPGLAVPADDTVLTLAAVVPGAPDEATGPHPAGGAHVSGTYLVVPYADSADLLVVATADGLVVVTPGPGVRVRRAAAVGGDPLSRVDLDGAAATPVPGRLEHVLDHLAVTALASTVGVAEGALTRSVQHAQDRHQFGRPIGSFQAVAHRCADMRSDIDACRLLAYRAAWALARDLDDRVAVDSALAFAKDALRRVAMHSHQVHGAIGFSTEHDLHRFTRRIKAFELAGGGGAAHREQFARDLGLRW